MTMTYKKLLILLFLFSPLFLSTAGAQGIPFLRNYSAEVYQAHNHNFDVEMGADGTVFIANFEGVMYYDHVPSFRFDVIESDKSASLKNWYKNWGSTILPCVEKKND